MAPIDNAKLKADWLELSKHQAAAAEKIEEINTKLRSTAEVPPSWFVTTRRAVQAAKHQTQKNAVKAATSRKLGSYRD